MRVSREGRRTWLQAEDTGQRQRAISAIDAKQLSLPSSLSTVRSQSIVNPQLRRSFL